MSAAPQTFDIKSLLNGQLNPNYQPTNPILSQAKPAPAAAPAAPSGGGGGGQVYWVGTDGNVWLKGPTGVKNVGKPSNLQPGGFDAGLLSAQATRINDPNPGNTGAPTNPNNTGGGTVLPDKSNDIALQNAGLGSVDTQTQAGIDAINKALSSLTGQYDTEANTNETSYKTNSDQNTNNLQKNKQTAFVNAAQGRQGLFGTLSSLGALNGSGIDLANRAVQNGANEDLSGAQDNFATNAQNLDTSIGAFRQADKERRQAAATSAENATTNVKNEGAKSRQTYYSNLANDYSAMGNEGEAKRFTGLAADLFPTIATTNVPNSNIGYTGAAYTPASLASYLAGNGSTAVTATPSGGNGIGANNLPGLVATDKKKLQPA